MLLPLYVFLQVVSFLIFKFTSKHYKYLLIKQIHEASQCFLLSTSLCVASPRDLFKGTFSNLTSFKNDEVPFLLKIGLFSVLSYDHRGQRSKSFRCRKYGFQAIELFIRNFFFLLLFYLILFRDCENGKSDNLEIA